MSELGLVPVSVRGVRAIILSVFLDAGRCAWEACSRIFSDGDDACLRARTGRKVLNDPGTQPQTGGDDEARARNAMADSVKLINSLIDVSQHRH